MANPSIMGDGAMPPWQAFEQVAVQVMRRLGFSDASATQRGADGGIDVRASRAIAQVKARVSATSRPEIQQLYGVARAEGKQGLFFSLGGFSDEALEWAEHAGVALFILESVGAARPVGALALSLARQPHSTPLPTLSQQTTSQLERVCNDARTRGEPLGHLLLVGRPGTETKSLAATVAVNMGTKWCHVWGIDLVRVGDVAALFASMQVGNVVLISEIEKLSRPIERCLRKLMQSWKFDVELGKGKEAKTIVLDFPKVTVIGSTMNTASVSAPLLEQFRLQLSIGLL